MLVAAPPMFNVVAVVLNKLAVTAELFRLAPDNVKLANVGLAVVATL